MVYVVKSPGILSLGVAFYVGDPTIDFVYQDSNDFDEAMIIISSRYDGIWKDKNKPNHTFLLP